MYNDSPIEVHIIEKESSDHKTVLALLVDPVADTELKVSIKRIIKWKK